MGTGININCSECGYSKKLYLGVGIQYYPLTVELIQELITDSRVKKEVIERLENGVEPDEFYKALMRCKACNVAYEKFYIEFNDGYATEYMCSECHDPLELITIEQIEKTKCPRCHGKSIRIYDRFNWD